MEKAFFEYRSIVFARNLLRDCPTLLKTKIDVDNILRTVVSYMDGKEEAAFKKRLLRLAGDEERLVEGIDEFFNYGAEDGRISTRLTSFLRKNCHKIGKLFALAFETTQARIADSEYGDLSRRLDDLKNSLNLETDEIETIILIYTAGERYGVFARCLNDDEIWEERYFLESLPMFLGVSRQRAMEIAGKQGSLRKLNIIIFSSSSTSARPDIAPAVERYLSGINAARNFSEELFDRIDLSSEVPRPLCVSKTDWQIVKSIMTHPIGCNILLHGAPGTGKTSMVKRLSQELGYEIFSIRNNEDGSQKDRIRDLMCAIKYAKNSDRRLILVDEADRLLCTRYSWSIFGERSDKGWLNKALENPEAKVFWVTNTLSGAEPETLRRFSYSISFKRYSNKDRMTIWKAILDEYPDVKTGLSEEKVAEYATRYALEPAQIRECLMQAAKFPAGDAPMSRILERHIESQLIRIGREPKKSQWRSVCSEYSFEGLNANFDLEKAIAMVGSFFMRLDDTEKSLEIPNMNLLLNGPPGSGKTQFVRHMAQTLNRPLIIKTASDLQSCYIGECEKNIAAAFEEAERDKAILFIDEADTFLFAREGAYRSWEISQVNEFLCQMENFKGVLICATNFMDKFDSAAIRRFSLKIAFGWLTPKGVEFFFKRYFSSILDRSPLDEKQLRRLHCLNAMAPGDFKVVKQKYGSLSDEDITVDLLIAGLEDEQRYKRDQRGGRIGF
ncbi:MAG: ATP-binding protein [Oligoflexales bacterium]|nr:ATP-binding protein [Oligoflexales bacterium]